MNYFGMADADWGWKKRYVYKQLRCNANKLIIIPHDSSTWQKIIYLLFFNKQIQKSVFQKRIQYFLSNIKVFWRYFDISVLDTIGISPIFTHSHRWQMQIGVGKKGQILGSIRCHCSDGSDF